jgi:hypothetical protein
METEVEMSFDQAVPSALRGRQRFKLGDFGTL